MYRCVVSTFNIAPESIPEQNIREVIRKVNLNLNYTKCAKVNFASSEKVLREIVMEENVLDCITEDGFTKPLSALTLAEKSDIVSTITTYHLFVKVHHYGRSIYIAFM